MEHFNLTEVKSLYNLGMYDSAIFYLKKFLEKDEFSFSLNRYLAKVCFDIGKKDLCYKHLAKSRGKLFRGKLLDKFSSLDDFLKNTEEAYRNIGIKEISMDGFN